VQQKRPHRACRGDEGALRDRGGIGGYARPVPLDPDALELMGLFAERARVEMLQAGWELDGDERADGSSQFLGDFMRAISLDFVATVQFTLASGPVVNGMILFPSGPRRHRYLMATVGGSCGVRHVPTHELLATLGIRGKTDISLDLEDCLEARGEPLPVITDEPTAERAARVLATTAARDGLMFARDHADVDAMVQFLMSGGQADHSELFAAELVPALLAAAGRPSEAKRALAAYRERFADDPDDLEQFEDSARRLQTRLDD
jgi:hypothetical protein